MCSSDLVDQPGCNDGPGDIVDVCPGKRVAQSRHKAPGKTHIGNPVDPLRRVNHPPAAQDCVIGHGQRFLLIEPDNPFFGNALFGGKHNPQGIDGGIHGLGQIKVFEDRFQEIRLLAVA